MSDYIRNPPPTPPPLGDYKAFGSFSPIYIDAKVRIWECYPVPEARSTLFVLDSLAAHAGPLGTMFRLSWRRIMKTSHMRFEHVQAAVRRIIYDLDFLREHRIVMPTRGKDIVDWQLSPFVVWIAQPSINEAMRLWYSAKQPNVSTMETQPESEPDSGNQNQQPDSKPESQTRNSVHGNERFQWIEAPIESCRKPLGWSEEQLAKDLVKNLGTGITQARQMIQTYGAGPVTQKLNEVQRQMLSQKVHKPAALMLTVLRTAYGKKQG